MREIGVRKGRRSRTLGGFQGALKKTTVSWICHCNRYKAPHLELEPACRRFRPVTRREVQTTEITCPPRRRPIMSAGHP
jgi:hypothetical protein